MPSEPVLSLSGGGDGGQLQRTCQGCHMGRPNLVLLMLLSGCQEPCTDVAASIFQGFSSTPGHRGALKHRHSATAVRRLQKKGEKKKKNMQCSVDAALCTADTRSHTDRHRLAEHISWNLSQKTSVCDKHRHLSLHTPPVPHTHCMITPAVWADEYYKVV